MEHIVDNNFYFDYYKHVATGKWKLPVTQDKLLTEHVIATEVYNLEWMAVEMYVNWNSE